MPRIPNYTDDAGVQLNLPLIDGVSSRVSNDTARLGLQMAERRGNDWLRVSELANAIAIRQQALRNSAEVSNAIAAATAELDTVRNAQLERKGLDATGRPATEDAPEVLSAMDTYGQGASSIQEKIRNNLLNDVQKQKFDEWYRNRYVSDMDTVARHQTQQLNVATENATQALLNSAKDSAYAAIVRGDFTTAENTFNNNYGVKASTMLMQGQSEEVIRQAWNNDIFGVAKAAVDQMVKNGDSEAGNRAVDYFGKYLTQQQKNELKGTVRPGIIKDDAASFIKKSAVYNTDGSLNEDATLKALEAEATRRGSVTGFDVSGLPPRVQEVAPVVFEVARERGYKNPLLALTHMMCETNRELSSYLADNTDNFGGVKATDPTEDELANWISPEGNAYVNYRGRNLGLKPAIEKVFDVLDDYGCQNASNVTEWNSCLQDGADGYKYYGEFDENGNPQRPGREANQQAFMDELSGRLKKGEGGKPDEAFLEAGRAALNRLSQDNKIALQQRAKDLSESFLKSVSTGGIATMSDAYKWAENNCATEQQKIAYLHKYKEMNNLLTDMDKEQEQAAMGAIFEDIAQGKIMTKEQLDSYPASQKTKDAITKAYLEQGKAWAKLPGIDGVLSDKTKQLADTDHRGQIKFVLMEAVSNEIAEKQRNNPTWVPTQWEVKEIIDRQSSNLQVKQKEGYILWQSTYKTKYPRAALVALGEGAVPIDGERVKDANGVVWIYDKKALNFKVDL